MSDHCKGLAFATNHQFATANDVIDPPRMSTLSVHGSHENPNESGRRYADRYDTPRPASSIWVPTPSDFKWLAQTSVAI